MRGHGSKEHGRRSDIWALNLYKVIKVIWRMDEDWFRIFAGQRLDMVN